MFWSRALAETGVRHITMSNKYNDQWLEAAQENFQEALVNGNTDTAKAIIEDTHEAGFEEAAKTMRWKLRETTIEKAL